jgi:Holliday junction resolvasome RuvABC endonuclease subunit
MSAPAEALMGDEDHLILRHAPRAPGRVLALDCGRTVGWALYDPARDLMRCGSMDFRRADDIGKLTARFQDWLISLCIREHPALISMERPFGNARFTNQEPVILVGVAHAVAYRRGIPRSEFTASALKKGIAGSGKATKREMIEAIKRLGFSPADDHAADAAACAVMAWAKQTQERAAA